MEYISAEEFLKQNEKVQRVFKEYFDRSEMLYTFNDEVRYGEFRDELDYTPNIVEGQLRKFIEDKTGLIINISYKHKPKDGYMELQFDFYECSNKNQYIIYVSTKDIIASSILDAWWKVACEVANESC